MSNPALVLRGGNSGPTFADSTPGFVLTIQADGKSVAPAAGGGGTIDASEVVNDSDAPGVSVADALSELVNAPSFVPEFNAGNSGANLNLNYANGSAQRFTLTANCALVIGGLVDTRTRWMQLKAIQGGAGGFTLTITGAKTPGSAGLTLSVPAGSQDIVSVYWDGTALYAQVGGLAFA